MKKTVILLILNFLAFYHGFAQNKVTLSGIVKEAKTGETLINAIIKVKELPGTGAVTNEYGFYSLSIAPGKYTLIISYVGFVSKNIEINLNTTQKLNIELSDDSRDLKEVVVTAEKANSNVSNTKMGTVHLDVREANKVPVIFGEKDIIKTMTLMPGVITLGEGNTGFYVRGGGADQNLILLDEATVYNPSHLLGFFSIFNSDAIKDVNLYKGSIPAEYGGRVSSVMDVRMNDGNDKKFGVNGGIGLIASRLTVEGPLGSENGSFIVSGRRTYADLFLKLSGNSQLASSSLYFYDLNAKANYKFGEKDRVYLSGYFGRDAFSSANLISTDWGNATGTLRWNHLFTDKLFLNSSFIASNYSYNNSRTFGANSYNINSGIRDYSLKEDFHYYINPENNLKFGLQSTYHTFVPATISGDLNALSGKINSIPNKYSWENAAYISDEFGVGSRWKMNLGLRFSSFSLLGNGHEVYTYDHNGVATDSANYASNTFIHTYYGLEPRVGITYLINDESSLKASYFYNQQYLHLLSNSTISTPNDLWVPSSNNVKPQQAQQYSIGYFRNLHDNDFEFSVETYYKNLYNQIDYRTGADLTFNPNVEQQLIYGTGKAYGAEFFLRKKTGKLTGWVSYTLSRTLRNFDDIYNGATFPARQDRIHTISVVGIYELNKKWSFSATFVYYTGNAVTFPSGKYEVNGILLDYYTERNGYRMPAYHRLDISATCITKKTDKFESNLNFSIFNVYAHENAYFIYFQKDPNNANNTQAVQVSLFKFVPSITYNFKF